MKKLILTSLVLAAGLLFLSASETEAALQLTTPAPVATSPNREYQPAIVEDKLGRIVVFSPSFGNADPSNLENLRIFGSIYDQTTDSFGTPQQITNLTRVSTVTALNDSTGTLNLIITKHMGDFIGSGRYDLFWTKNSGSGWSDPVRLTTYNGFDQNPTLVEVGSGNLGLVWERWLFYDQNGNIVSRGDPNYAYTSADLYQMSYTKSTNTWSAPTPIEATPFYAETYPTLAQGPGGKLYLAYASNETEGWWSIMWRSYSGGSWLAPTILDRGLMASYLQQPSIINDMPGKYRLVYAHKTPSSDTNFSSEIRYRTYDAIEDIWSVPVSITDRSQFYADMPSALFDSNGTYWLAFRYYHDPSFFDSITSNTDIYWIKTIPNTPLGSNVLVDLDGGSSITFNQVTQAGNTIMDTSTTNPGDVPGVFKIGDYYYDINTNALYNGNLTITLHYDDTGMTPEEEASLSLLHWNSTTNVWENATTNLDTANNILTGVVSSLSWFAVASSPLSVNWLPPIADIADGGVYTFNDGTTLPIKFNIKNAAGNLLNDPRVQVRISGSGGEKIFYSGTSSDSVRYDSTTGQYIVNLQTKNYDWIIPGGTYTVAVIIPGSGEVNSEIGNISIVTLDGGKAQGKNN